LLDVSGCQPGAARRDNRIWALDATTCQPDVAFWDSQRWRQLILYPFQRLQFLIIEEGERVYSELIVVFAAGSDAGGCWLLKHWSGVVLPLPKSQARVPVLLR
jgi:hypothetical protein